MSKNITPRNKKGQPHGLWEYYWTNGDLAYKSFYSNDKRVGYGEVYYNNNGYNGELGRKKYNI